MIPNLIRRVLSIFRKHQVRALLMGGQACVFYGAAQFSRDADFAVLCDEPNLERLAAALQELGAECVAVPPLATDFLRRGHAVHFRCHAAEVAQEILRQCAAAYPDIHAEVAAERPLLGLVTTADETTLERALMEEELAERIRDREYWRPLRAELERWRHQRD